MPLPPVRRLPRQSRSTQFSGVSEKSTRSDHVTRNALAARDNEAYVQGNGNVVLYSPSLSLKTLDTGILLLAVFKPELEMDYPSETSLCPVAPYPTDIPSPIFSEGRGRLYTSISEMDNPSSSCPSKLTNKVRRIVHSKLKPFHITYLKRIIQRITHLTRIIRL